MIDIYIELTIVALLLLIVAIIIPKLFGTDSIIVMMFAIMLDSIAFMLATFVLIHKLLALIV